MKNSIPNNSNISNSSNPKDFSDITLTTSDQFLDEMIKLIPSGQFTPYAYYNEDMDAIEVYFKDESCYTKTLNNMVELHLSFENEEVVGVNILGIKKLIQDKGKFK